MFTLDTVTLLFPHRARKGRGERRQRDMAGGGREREGRRREGEAEIRKKLQCLHGVVPEVTFSSFLL